MDLLKSLSHPEEVMAMLKWKLWASQKFRSKSDLSCMSPSLKSCYDMLNITGRSYAGVVQAIEGDLRDAVCLMYLVLRALDTVEDDMTIPLDVKIPMLRSFYKNLMDPDWKYTESKVDRYKITLEQFPAISQAFRDLDKMYQDMISEECQHMGEGMAELLVKKVNTLADLDEYCYIMSGHCGIVIAKCFSASGREDPMVGQSTELANDLGLISQKTNVVRDFLEDWHANKIFWPKSVWSKYVDDIGDFVKVENLAKALQCLNELITNALELIPSIFKVLGMLKNQDIFYSVALPQVMAIATLERCYNNPNVFKGVVKIRRGEAVRIILEASSSDKVKAILRHYILRIMARIPSNDPSGSQTRAQCQKALEWTDMQKEATTSIIYPTVYASLGLLTGISYTYWSH